MSEWISVKDRLPDENQEILAFPSVTFSNTSYVGHGAHQGKAFIYDWLDDSTWKFSYWMPFPKPPEEA